MATKRFFILVISVLMLALSASARKPNKHKGHRSQPRYEVKHHDHGRRGSHHHHRNDATFRMGLLLDFLAYHATIDVRQYARLTGLSLRMAEAELRSFARDARVPVIHCPHHTTIFCLSFR